MNAAWRAIEYLPKKDKYKEWKARKSTLGFYIPDAEPRVIPEDALIHGSAIEKIANDPKYKPVEYSKEVSDHSDADRPGRAGGRMPTTRMTRSAWEGL